MSGNDKHAVLLALIAITTVALLGVLTHALPWVGEHRAELALALLLLILAVGGCVAAAALLLQLTRPGTPTGTDARDVGGPDGLQEPTTTPDPTAHTAVLR
jgi:ABC-type Fe3+ transport system permease subunit